MYSHILIGTLILAYFTLNVNGSVKGYISSTDTKKFLSVLSKSLSEDSTDIAAIYYGAVGYKLLNSKVDTQLIKKSCDSLRSNLKGDENPEIIFQAYCAWKDLNCPGKIQKEETLKYLRNVVINEKSSPSDIRFASEALKVIGETLPNPAKVSELLLSKLKEDDTLITLGHAIHTSSLLGNHGKFAIDRAEDVVVQLDEVNGKLLQWEGGLSTTSLLLTGLLKLPGLKPLTQVQADKISNYLLTRKTVQTAKGIVALLEAIKALTTSSVSPVSIGIIGKSSVSIDKPELKVRVSNLLGQPIKPIPGPIVAISATRVVDDVVVLSKQPLTAGSGPTEFILPLRLDPDHYQVVLNTGDNTESFNIRVIGTVSLKSFEIGLGDLDGTGAPRFSKLDYPNRLSNALQADSSHLLLAKFSLSRSIHQAFLRLHSAKKEITFIAEQDNNKVYKVEINLNAELTYSGTFDIELILGDPVMSNPMTWNVGKIDINLGRNDPDVKSVRGPKPEIKHLFRQAEKRPSTTVSLLFSILTAAPLLLLLILWMKIGINIKNFSVVSLPFHLGFGSILCLFLCFWLKLDMFTTCAWLIPLGAFTFLSGHKVLSKLASSNKKSDKKD
ncbi:dolichyl-diphosphooligosaccharide--protein glycosyltransferase subunit 2 [Coccinella septempunctata]|uniref:dolichyl-diphosphooligosaccharide--protein glycosyltransferase subunit 2 n=1 Tax=Coccinella septempunctata TaxID=41139 RepID=UPI001D0600DA|nr:dolichyl-diphosphooligosaccharide--protein glycosyltransferase subunit 2 [Coccinella septempunctata]